MRRREFIGLLGSTAAAFPLAARAQQNERVRRIGVLMGYAEGDPETKSRLTAFRAGLAKRGWSEGGNIRIDIRFAAAKTDEYAPLAMELLALQPDAVRARHIEWYTDVAEQCALGLSGPDEGPSAEQLEREFENCREAHANAVGRGRFVLRYGGAGARGVARGYQCSHRRRQVRPST